MKKWIALVLCLSLLAALGCKAGTEPVAEPAAEETPAQSAVAEEAPVVVAPEEGTPLVQLESLDYDEAKKQVLVNITRMTFIPAPEGGLDTDYQIVAAENVAIEQLPMSANGIVDFPMADDFAKTVTITAEELPSEYEAYMAANEGAKLLFTMTVSDANEIISMQHFYTP